MKTQPLKASQVNELQELLSKLGEASGLRQDKEWSGHFDEYVNECEFELALYLIEDALPPERVSDSLRARLSDIKNRLQLES